MGDQEQTTKTADENTAAEYTPGPDAVDITPNKDGGVLKEIKKVGSDADGQPQKGEKVFVHYVGTLTDGTTFDSSRDRGEYFEFQLGKGQVIKAWDIGVATMKKGEVAVLTCQSNYAYGEKGSPPKIPPKATLIFEVELFYWKGEDISPDKDEGILRSQIDAGDGHQSPNDDSSCEVHITGKYDGRVFEDRDVEFIVGEGSESNIVQGVENAIKKFKKGEKSKLKIKSKYAYGSEGNKDYNIPADADLEYEVTLKTFEKGKESWEMDAAEKVEQSELMKQKGTNFFKQGKYKLALSNYKRIIDYLEKDTDEDETKEKRTALLLAAHLNSAMCLLKLDQDFEAKASCDKAIELDPTSEKGYFRKGTANMNLKDYEEAQKDFKKVVEIDPNNKAAKKQLAIVNAKIKQILDKEKKTYAGMFQKFADIDAKKEKEHEKEQQAKEQDNVESAVNGTDAADEVPSESKEEVSMES